MAIFGVLGGFCSGLGYSFITFGDYLWGIPILIIGILNFIQCARYSWKWFNESEN